MNNNNQNQFMTIITKIINCLDRSNSHTKDAMCYRTICNPSDECRSFIREMYDFGKHLPSSKQQEFFTIMKTYLNCLSITFHKNPTFADGLCEYFNGNRIHYTIKPTKKQYASLTNEMLSLLE